MSKASEIIQKINEQSLDEGANSMTPVQYILSRFKADKLSDVQVVGSKGAFFLADGDGNILKGSKQYSSKSDATDDRTKIIAKAQKQFNK